MSGAEGDPAEEVAALRRRNAELEETLAASRAAAEGRLVAAELRAEAVRAGIVDMDALRLLDGAGVSVAGDGQVVGAERAIAKLRQDKPYLFRNANTSAAVAAPEGGRPVGRMATEMSLEEWRRARAELLRRR